VDRMLNAVKRMQALINDLLALSRVTSRARPAVAVDLNQTLRDVLNDLEPRIAAVQARVEVGPLPTIEGDPLQMHQLFQNLVGNAIKFHRENAAPEVRVHARTACSLPEAGPGDVSELVVQDNGIGFDEKYAERIFGIFQRLHTRGAYDGTGIGLAVCRKIAQRHGGTVTAHSRPGEGAEFVVRLPCRQVTGPDEGGRDA
jgi:signal transduction histidine kinase